MTSTVLRRMKDRRATSTSSSALGRPSEHEHQTTQIRERLRRRKPDRFKATASGFGYIFVKAASFFGAFAFPVLSAAWGTFGATLAVALLSLTGFLAAKFILPEVYGHVETEEMDLSRLHPAFPQD